MPTNYFPHVFSRIYVLQKVLLHSLVSNISSASVLRQNRVKKSPQDPCFSREEAAVREKKVCGVSPREQNATQGEEVSLGRRCLRNFAEAKKNHFGGQEWL